MRSIVKNARLPLALIIASFMAATPVLANTAPAILFMPGTGAVAADTAYDAPAPLPFADSDAPLRDARDAEADMIAMGETLSNPGMQDGVANMVEKMTSSILRLPVGKFANAIEKARPGTVGRRIRDRDTIADIAGKDMRDVPEMLGKQSRVAMGMMGGLTKAFASMMPEFEKMGRDMEASMADLKVKRR
jgi:hypothetical protein